MPVDDELKPAQNTEVKEEPKVEFNFDDEDDNDDDLFEDKKVEDDVQATETKTEEPPAEDPFAKATEDFKARMAKLGAKFDDAGNYIGFDGQEFTPKPKTQTEFETTEEQLAGVKNDILREMAPAKIELYIETAMKLHPALKKYEPMVRDMSRRVDPATITQPMVEGWFWYLRGQGADVEIGEAVNKTKTVTKEKQATAVAQMSESAGGKTTPTTTKGKVTREIYNAAKEWNLDPQKLADKMLERQKKGTK